MASLIQQYDYLAANAIFARRVRMGYVTVAREVLADPTADTLDRAFGRAVIAEQGAATETYVALVASDATVQAEAVAGYVVGDADSAAKAVADATVLAAIRTTWNALAGVDPTAA